MFFHILFFYFSFFFWIYWKRILYLILLVYFTLFFAVPITFKGNFDYAYLCQMLSSIYLYLFIYTIIWIELGLSCYPWTKLITVSLNIKRYTAKCKHKKKICCLVVSNVYELDYINAILKRWKKKLFFFFCFYHFTIFLLTFPCVKKISRMSRKEWILVSKDSISKIMQQWKHWTFYIFKYHVKMIFFLPF